MSNSKVSVKDKLYAVKLYLDGKKSQHQIADVYGVKLSSVQQWIRNYESLGANAFTQKEYRKYSKELKEQAVLDYLAGQGSQDDICKKYLPEAVNKSLIFVNMNQGKVKQTLELYEDQTALLNICKEKGWISFVADGSGNVRARWRRHGGRRAPTDCRSAHKERQKLGLHQQPKEQTRSEADQSRRTDLIFPTHKNHPAHSMRGG